MTSQELEVMEDTTTPPFVESTEMTESVLRSAYGHFPSGVTALCGTVGDAPVGIAASSFTSVSIDPAYVSVCVANTSSTWPVLRTARRLGVSVLSENHGETARALAAKGKDRFADIDWVPDENGAVFIADSSLWLDCSIEQEVQAGDHLIALLRIHRFVTRPGISPMVFHGSRFHALAAR
ncbi:flavin reductase family protein [Dietzia aurantiaca]|uniref:Flavin reductase family protein n=1 Tax=Dietzia aurantiaca TaxID=983873 RepID=A0ABV9PS88_9ACTN